MASSDAPNRAAVLEGPKTQFKPRSHEIPTPQADEILVRSYAVAVNPVDWKIQTYDKFVYKYPVILGSDVSGEVVATGSSVTKFKKGDRVAGFAGTPYHGNLNTGAFQTYTCVPEYAATRIGEKDSYPEGTTYPMAVATVGTGLWANLKLPKPAAGAERPAAAPGSGFLVWGASSSVGTAAVQIGKILGRRVFATASAKHHEYIKSLGADEVFDYHSPGVVDEIISAAKAAGTPLTLGFDAISEGETFELASKVVAAFKKTKDGEEEAKMVITLGWPESLEKPEGVQIEMVFAYDLFTDHKDLSAWLFNDFLPEAIEKGTIVPAPRVEIVPGGVDAAQTALDKSKAGVSATKLVIEP